MRATRWTALVAAAVMALSGSQAFGQARDLDRVKAEAEYKKGVAALNLAHYQEAVAAFEEAYKISPDPILLYNVAQAHRMNGDLKKAQVLYESYLREAPPNAPERTMAKARIDGIKRELEERKASQAVPALSKPPAVSERSTVELAPTSDPVRAPTPPLAPAVGLRTDTLAATVPPRASPWYRSRWTWIAGGAVVLAVATSLAIVFGRDERFPDATMGKQVIGD
jgi:tetratricopeptide (TPR) repeat protein